MYRNTYVQVDTNQLYQNIQSIKKNYSDYQYYIGVVKNNAYNHGIECIEKMLEAGINYLAVSSLDEAMRIRELYSEVPILVLEPIRLEYMDVVSSNDITITVDSLSYLKELVDINLKSQVKVHFKLDTGMNRLGFKDKEELDEAYSLVKKSKALFLEGIYTHFATAGRYDVYYEQQLDKFNYLTQNIDLDDIPIVHIDRSLTFVSHEKQSNVNGVRLGIVMYGFSGSVKQDNSFKGKLRSFKRDWFFKKNKLKYPILENSLEVKPAFSLYSEVISVRKVKSAERVGYNASYLVENEGVVATIAIGYADGVTKDFKEVFINNKRYPIVSDSMDMIMILGDETIKVGDKVEIWGDNISVREVTNRLGINSYHLFNQITSRVPRIFVKK